MPERNMRDIISGGALAALGVFVSVYAHATLSLGTLTRMGPGLFPFSLGILLVLFGLGILIPAFRTPDTMEKVNWRPLIVVTIAICLFAATVRPIGLIPAIVLMLLVSTLSERRIKPVELAILLVGVPLAAWLIFIVGLGVPLPLARWPF